MSMSLYASWTRVTAVSAEPGSFSAREPVSHSRSLFAPDLPSALAFSVAKARLGAERRLAWVLRAIGRATKQMDMPRCVNGRATALHTGAAAKRPGARTSEGRENNRALRADIIARQSETTTWCSACCWCG